MATRFGIRTAATVATALGLVTALAGTARASDFCIEYTESNLLWGQLVGKGFRVPGPGRCKPFYGFAAGGATGRTLTGSACTVSAGDKVRFTLTESYPGGWSGVFHVDLVLPLGQGGTITEQFADGTFASLSDPDGFVCPTKMFVP
jgi:hypothetical protein